MAGEGQPVANVFSCSPSSDSGDQAFPKNMIGPASEGLVKFDNRATVALFDTGSQISTVSRSFCDRCSLEVKPLSQFLSLEAAGGFQLPYLGFVEAKIVFPEVFIRTHGVRILDIFLFWWLRTPQTTPGFLC